MISKHLVAFLLLVLLLSLTLVLTLLHDSSVSDQSLSSQTIAVIWSLATAKSSASAVVLLLWCQDIRRSIPQDIITVDWSLWLNPLVTNRLQDRSLRNRTSATICSPLDLEVLVATAVDHTLLGVDGARD